MLSPDELLHISEGGEEIAEQLHSELIRKMVYHAMLRIGRGEDYLFTATDKWHIQTLQEAGYLLEDIQKEIAKYTKLQQSEIAEAMEDAGVKALEYDDNIYQQAGLSPVPLTQSPHLVRIMQRNYESTMGEWNNFTRTMAEKTQRNFIYQLDKAYNLVATGALSYTEAVKDVVNSVISDGATVKYATGHEDTIETATLRAIRTGISQATAQIQIERMNEMDVDLVITSSHLGARPSHQVWQGKIFSRSGVSKYPNFVESTGYGSVTGLCGVNCRHSFSPYFEGMDNPFEQFDSEENKKQYEKEQRQRVLERRIRKTKREVMGLKESVDNCKDDKAKFALDMDYQRKAALLQKQNKAYRDYCKENGLKQLNDRIQIARWDRQQAAAARGAAKRYEKTHGGSVAKTVSKAVADEQKVTSIIKIKSINESVDKLKEIGFTSVDEKVLNLDEKIVVNSVNQLQDLEIKFGAIKKTECSFSVDASFFQEERAKGAIAGVDDKLIADGIDYNYDLSINSTFFNDRDKTIKQQKLSIEKYYTMPCGEDLLDSYAVTHEYGHLLQDSLLNEQFDELSIEYKKVKSQYDSAKKTINLTTNIKEKIELSDKIYDLSEEMQMLKGKMRKSWDSKARNAKQINEEIIAIAKDLLRKEDEDFTNLSDEQIEVTGFMSRYGRSTAYEFFAEAFANSQCGKPNLLGKAMNIWLERKGYKL